MTELKKIFIICFVIYLSPWVQATELNIETNHPSVDRRILFCDAWQWIGNGAVTWGCLKTPRQGSVAHGQTTDQVILSLQTQIDELKTKLKSIESNSKSLAFDK